MVTQSHCALDRFIRLLPPAWTPDRMDQRRIMERLCSTTVTFRISDSARHVMTLCVYAIC